MSQIASASVTRLARAKESTYATAPTTGSAYTKMRYTGESLSQEVQTATSNEINDDRQTSDLIRTDLGAAGGINFEFSYGTYDLELLALLHEDTGDWVAGATHNLASCNITGGNALSGDWSSLTAHAGKFARIVVRAAGPGAIEQTVIAKLSTATAGGATLTLMETALTNVTGKDVTVTVMKMATNGVTRQSFTYERFFSDAEGGTGNYAYNKGYTPNSISLSISAGAIITGSIEFIGSIETAETAALWTGSQNAATTTKVMNGIDHVEAVLEGGSGFRFSRLDLTIGNNINAHKAVSILGAFELTSGQLAVSGSVSAYFNTKAQFDKFLNFVDTNLVLMFRDQTGNEYVLEIPDVKFTAGKRNAAGINQPVIAELSFGAIKDPTIGKTLRLFALDA